MWSMSKGAVKLSSCSGPARGFCGHVSVLPQARVDPRVKVRLPEPYMAGLRALALRRGTTFSDYLRDLVRSEVIYPKVALSLD